MTSSDEAVTNLKPYPAYKDSGVPWLGQVPEHWELRQLGRIGRLAKGNGGSKEDNVTDGIPCIRYGDLYMHYSFFIRRNYSSISRERTQDYTPIKYGDVLFAGSGETFEEIGKSAVSLIKSEAYCGGDIIVFRPTIDVDPWFLGYATDCPQATFQKALMGRGFTVKHIYSDQLKYLWIALPSRAEQAAIVRYLNYINLQIRQYIRAKQKLIKLLEEQKQAIIQQAVTRGLDPNVRLKPSGVEWLGDVPEHWEVLPLKRVVSTRITDGPHETPTFLDEGVDFLSAESMVNGHFIFERRRGYISRELHESYCQKCRPRRDDIFMCKSGATTGKVAIVETDKEFSVWSPLALIRVDETRALSRFMFAALQSRYVQGQVRDISSYGTQPNLAMGAMERLIMAVPPLDEQHMILNQLDSRLGGIEARVALVTRANSLLLEHRSSLIADVVTGKLDVQKVVTSLPEEPSVQDLAYEEQGLITDDDAAETEDQGDQAEEINE